MDRPTDGNPSNSTVDFLGEKLRNATHQPTTDSERRLMRKAKGKELLWGTCLDGEPEWSFGGFAADAGDGDGGGDNWYDKRGFVVMLRSPKNTPHVTQDRKRRGGSAIDGRTTRHVGYSLSQRIHKKVEEIFGWVKVVGECRKPRFKGGGSDAVVGLFCGGGV